MSRCQAVVGKGSAQCRATKHLTRTQVSLFRSKDFIEKLPEGAIILLCPKHLRLSVVERLVLSCKSPTWGTSRSSSWNQTEERS